MDAPKQLFSTKVEYDRGIYLVAWMEGMTKSTFTICPYSFALSLSAQQHLCTGKRSGQRSVAAATEFFSALVTVLISVPVWVFVTQSCPFSGMGVDMVFTEVFLYSNPPLRSFSEDGSPRGPWLADFGSASLFPAFFMAWLSVSSSTCLFTAFIGVHAVTAFLRADLSSAVDGASSVSPSRGCPRARYMSQS